MNEITLDVRLAKTTIDPNIYGHFSVGGTTVDGQKE